MVLVGGLNVVMLEVVCVSIDFNVMKLVVLGGMVLVDMVVFVVVLKNVVLIVVLVYLNVGVSLLFLVVFYFVYVKVSGVVWEKLEGSVIVDLFVEWVICGELFVLLEIFYDDFVGWMS